MPRITDSREPRQTGTSAPTERAIASSDPKLIVVAEPAAQQPQGGGGIGRATAEAGGDRQVLEEAKLSRRRLPASG